MEILRYAHSHYLRKSFLGSDQELLLFANDHACSADTHPGDQWLGIEAKLVHDVEAN